MVILFRMRLAFLVILCALPLIVIGAFVSLAATGRALDLSALIGLLMLRGIVVTNAIVLRDLAQHKTEARADVRTALMQGGRMRVRPMLMTVVATIQALIPLTLSSGRLIAASHGRSGRQRAGRRVARALEVDEPDVRAALAAPDYRVEVDAWAAR
jgi:multidrug efflux pump subunit AcrB